MRTHHFTSNIPASKDPSLSSWYFLFISYFFTKTHPNVCDGVFQTDFEEPSVGEQLELEHSNIWLGNGKTLGRLHFDEYENLLCQVTGSKHLALFPPHANEQLYEGYYIPAALLSSSSLIVGKIVISVKHNYNLISKRANLNDRNYLILYPWS
jgi:hypothetical protein